jgi:hypothetical protein
MITQGLSKAGYVILERLKDNSQSNIKILADKLQLKKSGPKQNLLFKISFYLSTFEGKN